jgi:stress response protein YsnF
VLRFVAKDARVTEEVVVNKDVNERTEEVADTVRHTEVEVEDVRDQTPTPERRRARS